jgi:catechol 2,3-dioxygenase-like lactoylglutathione lyase family enzyme
MIDHMSLKVLDVPTARNFYAAALKPLKFGIVMEFPEAVGMGPKGHPVFWLSKSQGRAPTHIAFMAATRPAVDAFYQAALAAGGRDNGAPGLRPQYHKHYYGAFVFDPDGNNIEAVCHLPLPSKPVRKAAAKQRKAAPRRAAARRARR